MPAVPLSNSHNASQASLSIAASNVKKSSSFIEANTVEVHFEEIKERHIIPVFHRDNERLISHVEFIEAVQHQTKIAFPAERILAPQIRLSHPILGRVPEAREKPARELLEAEKTIHYERMAFLMEVASVTDQIGGEKLCLTIGGIKAYNEDNLYNRKGGEQHFKLFIGFKVSVCTNLCISTDGYQGNVKVKSLQELSTCIHNLIASFDAVSCLKNMSELEKITLSEQQFAHLIGRCRMYPFLSSSQKREVPPLLFGDYQIGAVCKDYYRDASFCKEGNGINLWRLYNLFTAANKSTYIDSFLDKSANASELISSLAHAIQHKEQHWFLN